MADEFKIEKTVPLPPLSSHRAKYPWKTMDVGDSFFVAGKTTSNFSGSTIAGQRLGRKFTRRAVDGGIRIWRVE